MTITITGTVNESEVDCDEMKTGLEVIAEAIENLRGVGYFNGTIVFEANTTIKL